MATKWKMRGVVVIAALVLVAGISAVAAPTQASAAQDARITAAINWALNQQNATASRAYNNLCLTFVNDAYVKGAGVNLLVKGLGSAQQAANYFNAAANKGVPPRGAWAYYKNGTNGHVALSLGNGRCISSLGSAYGGIKVHSYLLSMPYIGWAYPLASPALGDTASPAPRPTVVVDDNGAALGGPSNWWHIGYVGYGGSVHWTWNNQSRVDNYAVWRPNLAGSNYEVQVFIPSNYANTTHAVYGIYGLACYARAVNQAPISNGWVSLGTYPFAAGTSGYVQLTDNTGEAYASRMIGFDAVQFIPR
jgi:hypothetical protein